MDCEQGETQFLGLLGIDRESYKASIISCKKIFTEIALASIVPLSFFILFNLQVSSHLVFSSVIRDKIRPESLCYDTISDLLSREWAFFLLFEALYVTIILALCLLSTSAVVYTVTLVYATRRIVKESFYKVITTIGCKAWRGPMTTILYMLLVTGLCNLAAILILIAYAVLVGPNNGFSVAMLVFLGIAYVTGFVYMTVVWQLPSVLSGLEEEYGIVWLLTSIWCGMAVVKSKETIKDKVRVAIAIFLKFNVGLFSTQWVLEFLFVFINVYLGEH